MEEKLAAYRARKAKEYESQNKFSSWIPTAAAKVTRRNTEMESGEGTPPSSDRKSDTSSAPVSMTKDAISLADERENAEELADKKPLEFNSKSLMRLAIKAVMWCALFGIFVCAGFGAVFFILSLFYLIYVNLRSGKKAPGEKSAYSVFNPECERIHGTLTAEEIERGMLYGIGGAMR